MLDSATSVRREVATLAPAALFLSVVLAIAARHDAGHRALLSACLAVVLTQVLPGVVIWRLVRPTHGWLVEDLTMGFAVGAALSVPCQVVAAAASLRWLAAVLPIAIAAGLLVVPAARERVRSREVSRLPWVWGAAVALSFVGPLLDVLSTFATPLRWHGWARFYVDAHFQQALAGEVMTRVPPHFPQVALEPLHYHWFAHAWTAQIAMVSGAELDVLLWRFNPTLLMVVAPVAVAVAAMRLSGRPWTGPLAALLAFLLPDVIGHQSTMISTPLHTAMSPTQQFSVPLLVGVLALLTLRWRGEASRWSMPLLAMLLVVMGGTKGSSLPVIFAGMLTASVVMAVTRSPQLRKVGADTLVAGGSLILLTRLMLGGTEGRLNLDFGQTFVQTWGLPFAGHAPDPANALGIATGLIAVLGILLGSAAGLGLLAGRATRNDPLAWLLLGGGAAGLGATIALNLTGLSQFYFYKSAETLIAVGAAWGASVLLQRAGSERALVIAGVSTGVVGSLLVQVATTSEATLGGALLALVMLLCVVTIGTVTATRATSTRRRGAVATAAVALIAAPAVMAVQAVAAWGPPPSPVARAPISRAIHDEDVQALRWLRDHSDPGDVIATNRHCIDHFADPCDRRLFVIAAFAERRVLIEGWTYTSKAALLYDELGSFNLPNARFWDQRLLALNDGFMAHPSATGAGKLIDLGVRWIVVWPDAPSADTLAPYAKPVHRGKTVAIYRLRDR